MLDDAKLSLEVELNIFYFDFNTEVESSYSYPPEDTKLSQEVDRLIDELIAE